MRKEFPFWKKKFRNIREGTVKTEMGTDKKPVSGSEEKNRTEEFFTLEKLRKEILGLEEEEFIITVPLKRDEQNDR